MKKLLLSTALCGALTLGMVPASFAASAASSTKAPATASAKASQGDATTAKLNKEVQERVLKDAVSALGSVNRAIIALQHKDKDAALSALADATGKLELVTSADPSLKLAPIDVSESLFDLYADPQVVDAARLRSINMLRAGDVQDARALLADMASELVVQTTSIPLGTYPEAIKAVVPLVSQGKYQDAVDALSAAMNTLVVTNTIIPLPSLRAEAAIEAARVVANTDKKLTAAQKAKLNERLDFARSQLRLSEALGYVDRGTYKQMHKDIEQLRKQVNAGGKGETLFKSILKRLKSKTDAAKKGAGKTKSQ